MGRSGQPAAPRRQLRALYRADGRAPGAHDPRARPLHRGLRGQYRQGSAGARQAVPHRGVSLEGVAAGPVRPALPHYPGAGCRPLHGEARLRRHRPGEARHREPDRGTAARRGGRSLPSPRGSRRAGLGAAARGRRGQAAGVPGFDDRQHPRPGRHRAASQHLRRRDPGPALRAGEGQDRQRRAECAQAVEEFRPGGPRERQARGGCAEGAVRGVFRGRHRRETVREAA